MSLSIDVLKLLAPWKPGVDTSLVLIIFKLVSICSKFT